MKFERSDKKDGWGMALMEMLTDPMLKQWVPTWVDEQYTRANPFFREVLTTLQPLNGSGARSNHALLRQTRREMIRRHHRKLAREASQKERDKRKLAGESVTTSGDGGGVSEDTAGSEADEVREADKLVSHLAGGDGEDPNENRVEIIREERPQAGPSGDASGQDEWVRRSEVERLSAAGQAPCARDRVLGAVEAEGAVGAGFERPFGVLFNPRNYPWTELDCNVHWSELQRLKALQDKWHDKAHVGDGADSVCRSELDPWQKFAYDVVADPSHSQEEAVAPAAFGIGWDGQVADGAVLRGFAPRACQAGVGTRGATRATYGTCSSPGCDKACGAMGFGRRYLCEDRGRDAWCVAAGGAGLR